MESSSGRKDLKSLHKTIRRSVIQLNPSDAGIHASGASAGLARLTDLITEWRRAAAIERRLNATVLQSVLNIIDEHGVAGDFAVDLPQFRRHQG